MLELQDAVKGQALEEVIGDILKAKWDHERTKFSLPPLMNLVGANCKCDFPCENLYLIVVILLRIRCQT